jgi:hypothetical protein
LAVHANKDRLEDFSKNYEIRTDLSYVSTHLGSLAGVLSRGCENDVGGGVKKTGE